MTAISDRLGDEIVATIHSLLGQKSSLFFFTMPRNRRGLYLAEGAESVDQSGVLECKCGAVAETAKTLVSD